LLCSIGSCIGSCFCSLRGFIDLCHHGGVHLVCALLVETVLLGKSENGILHICKGALRNY
jgi:hypothetical protein